MGSHRSLDFLILILQLGRCCRGDSGYLKQKEAFPAADPGLLGYLGDVVHSYLCRPPHKK